MKGARRSFVLAGWQAAGWEGNQVGDDRESSVDVARRAGDACGVDVNVLHIRMDSGLRHRWMIRIRDAKGEDARAADIAHAATALHALLRCTPPSDIVPVGFRTSVLRRRTRVTERALLNALDPGLPELEAMTVFGHGFSCGDDREVWRFLPVALDPKRLTALSYLTSSVRSWEVGLEPSDQELAGPLAARAESAFQDAYKAVETFVGEPGRNRARTLARLKATTGLDGTEAVGYVERRPLLDEIYRLWRFRDRNAAHGSERRQQRLTELSLAEAQECARLLVSHALVTAERNVTIGDGR